MTTSEKIKVLNLLGETVLSFGAETYRVEDTINRAATALGVEEFSSFVIPTGIFINYKDDKGAQQTCINRIYQKHIDLEKLDHANNLARKLTSRSLTKYSDIMAELSNIHREKSKTKLSNIILSSFAGCFFTLMLGGNFLEAIIAYVTSIMLLVTVEHLNVNFFLKNLTGGALIAIFTVLAYYTFYFFDILLNRDVLIIGPIMLLVPGVAITVGVKDIISGELVAGGARITEALFTSIAIAFGVGMVLYAGF